MLGDLDFSFEYVPQPREPAPLLALAMPGNQAGSLIAALGPLIASDQRAFCLDGGNLFVPYKLALWLRERELDMGLLADRIFISRAFTCHQLATAVRQMLPPLLDEPHPTLALILGLDRLFLDEDLPLFERRWLFDRIMSDARSLRERGLRLLISCGPEPDNPWTGRLRECGLLVADPAQAIIQLRRLTDGTHPTDV